MTISRVNVVTGAVQTVAEDAPAISLPVPEAISKVQFVRAMRAADLWDAHEATITAHPDWPFITILPRAEPLALAVAASIGATEAEMDAIWRAGAEL